jgi:hypothetical protein
MLLSLPGRVPDSVNNHPFIHHSIMSRSFVNAQGHLSRRPPLLPTYSKRRIVLVVSTLLLLILTNPANGTRSLLPNFLWTNVRYSERPGSTKATWFNSKPKSTNFIILALTRDQNRITATGLLRTFELCSTGSPDPLTQSVCTWIGDTFCHGKPVLDFTDLPYTLTRLLSLTLMASMLLSYCSYREPILRLPRALPWLEGAVSILQHPTWYDVARVQTCVYPALLCMHRMISTMVYERVKVDSHVIFGFMVLIVTIGTVGNRLGTECTSCRVTGLDASIGACLAYQRIIGSSLVLFQHDRAYFSILHFFWFTVVTYLLDKRMGQLVSFLTGAMLGNFFAVLQRQVIVETLLVRMEVGWRRFLDSFLLL